MSEHKRYTLLAVDDQEAVLRTIEVMVRDSPFALVTAKSAREALARAAEQPPDIMLLDILMPDISGIALVVQMRSDPALKDVPVVMLTAANDYALRRRAEAVGADDILLKPIGKKHLINKLLEVLARQEPATPAG